MTQPKVHQCKCDLAARQSKADADAAPLGKIAPRLWHGPACPIAMLVELRNVETRLHVLEDAPVLPDPTIEALHAKALTDLTDKRAQLRGRLNMNGDNGHTSTPKRAQPKGAR